MTEVTIRVRRLSPLARLPEAHSALAAGLDLTAAIENPITIAPGAIAMIPLGFAMAIPPGWEAQVRPRSGLASRHGVTLPNAPGTIDADYRGEVQVPLINHGVTPFVVEPQMRIAQMVIAQVPIVVVEETDELDETSRGPGGFGSTGLGRAAV